MAVSIGRVPIDALFLLACACILDGCSTSSPGRAWAEGRRGSLYCSAHGWKELVDVVVV